MTDREKLIELLESLCVDYGAMAIFFTSWEAEVLADHLIANGVTVRERGRWVHPKGCVVSNGFLCTECGHEEASHYPINPRPGGVCTADENGNFFHPPKINFCPNCGADMRPEGEGEEDG